MNKEKLVGILDKITEWSLYALVFSIPFSKTIIEASITVAFISWLFKKILVKDFRLQKTPLNMLLLAFFIASEQKTILNFGKILCSLGTFTTIGFVPFIITIFTSGREDKWHEQN